MGQAKQRGTVEERKAQAIVDGRTPGWRAREREEREKSRKFIDELTKKIMAKLFDSDFITERHKQRFSLVEAWRVNGSSEDGWREIEKFDEETERQERILSGMGT